MIVGIVAAKIKKIQLLHKVFRKSYTDFGFANSSKDTKKANKVAPAWVSKVSSGNIESNMMVRNAIYR
jgi:hypothetical protein